MEPISMLSLASLCVLNVQAAAAKQLLCEKVGWDAGRESILSTNDNSFLSCSYACTQKKKCKSFAYDSQDCQLYDKVVKANFVEDSGSPYKFFDIGCAQPIDEQQEPEKPYVQVCGSYGTFIGKKENQLLSVDTSAMPANLKTPSRCRESCGLNAGCQSYASAANSCTLYNAKVSRIATPSSNSSMIFWDYDCGWPGKRNRVA